MLEKPEGCHQQVWTQLSSEANATPVQVPDVYTSWKGEKVTDMRNITRNPAAILNDPLCELCHDFGHLFTDTMLMCMWGRADGVHNPNPRPAEHIVLLSTGQRLACKECVQKGLDAVNRTCAYEGSVTIEAFRNAYAK